MHKKHHLFLSIIVVIFCFLTIDLAQASVAHYWRFEDDSAFVLDYAGNSVLSPSETGVTQSYLADVGRGGNFPTYFTVPIGGTNSSAADFEGGGLSTNITPLTNNFTVEAFIHMDNANGRFGDSIVCVSNDITSSTSTSWNFQVRYDGAGNTQPQELMLNLHQGVNSDRNGSGFVLEIGIDYYIAAAFDSLNGEVSFWIKDLTNGGQLLKSTTLHSLTGVNSISNLAIGNDGTGHPNFSFMGLIDEVRISDQVLKEDELLVNNTSTVPLPGAIWLLGSCLVGFVGYKRKFKKS